MAVQPLALRLARVFAVVFALSVLGYLVVDAQSRANSRADAGATSPAQPAASTDARGAHESEGAPTASSPDAAEIAADPFDPEAQAHDASGVEGFLYSSKVAPILLDASGNPVEVFPPPPVEPERRTFIGSSKSLPIHVAFPEAEVREPTFLPTSKSGRVVLPVPSGDPAPEPEPQSVD